MNPIFSTVGEGWGGFPRKAFAKLDQTEPVIPEEANEAVFAFDTVDANWRGFSRGEILDLTSQDSAKLVASFWQEAFSRDRQRSTESPFEKLPVYRIEVTAKRGDEFWDSLISFGEDEWITLELSEEGRYPVEVYGGLLAAPVSAHLRVASLSQPQLHLALSSLFNVDHWPDASDADISEVISGLGDLESLVAYDVGQGAAVGLLDQHETARIFFDLGAGVYGNTLTRPKPLRFCWRANPAIILSHWDSDHWGAEIWDSGAAGRRWVAPRQPNLTITHHLFAERILTSGGSLLIWGAMPGSTMSSLPGSKTAVELVRCTGKNPKRNRNGTGISCLVRNSEIDRVWILTGDAGYHELGFKIPLDVSAVVVPHHGADMGPRSTPPNRPNDHARLIYTFGPDNTHGRTQISHPTPAAVRQHDSKGWSHGGWSLSAPGRCLASGDVLATANNRRQQTSVGNHLESAACGWAKAPTVPFTSVPCGSAQTQFGCTCRILQA